MISTESMKKVSNNFLKKLDLSKKPGRNYKWLRESSKQIALLMQSWKAMEVSIL